MLVLGCISCSSRVTRAKSISICRAPLQQIGKQDWACSLTLKPLDGKEEEKWVERERERESHGTEMLQLWEQRLLHLKTCYWRHRWSVRGRFQRLLGRTATAREQLCDKVKRLKPCLLWWLMINHYVTLINCWTANSACRLPQDLYWMAEFCHLQGFRQREDVRLLFPFSLHLLHCL